MTFILVTFCLVCCGQPAKGQLEDKTVDFSKIVQHFAQYSENSLFQNAEEYKVEISDTPVFFDIKEIVLKNPFDDKFPLSFSVIYQNRLISLFEQGKFVCHTIPSMIKRH